MRNPIDRLTAGLPHGLRVTIDWVVTLAVAGAIVLAVKAWVVNPYRIPTASMEPTLHCAGEFGGCRATRSDRVLANRFIYHLRSPRRGEIVVFETPERAQRACQAGGTFVKRLIGLPGDTIASRNGELFVNGEKLDESYVEPERMDARDGRWSVPPDQYFVVGDNRASSCDSRTWGSVPRDHLIGPVFAIYWPIPRISIF